MKTFFFLIALSVALCHAAEIDESMDPPSWTWIRWGDVGGNYFRVRWLPVEDADSYNVYLYKGYDSTNPVAQYENVNDTNFMIGGLEIFNVYGIRVQCVGKGGHLSRLGKPTRTWTFGKTTTTSTAAPTAPTPVGKCGVGFFTCETNDECIDESWWCDRKKDCADGTDERNCPGSCEEIVSWSPNGNFSCSRWNSPKSACFFQCNKTAGYQRDGAYWFKCVRGKWRLPVPTCRLLAPKDFTLLVISSTNVTFTFGALQDAASYIVNSLTGADGEEIQTPTGYTLEGDEVLFTIYDLNPDTTYTISINAVDLEDVDSFPTEKITFTTST